MKFLAGIAVGAVAVASISLWLYPRSADEYEWSVPDDMPLPPVPDDNLMSVAKVELGRWLFYDPRLSADGSMSCASCHLQRHAFADASARATGVTGELHQRGSMSLVNVAYASRLTWANHLLDRLEDQALIPMFSETPVEMGMAGREDDIVALLQSDERYQALLPGAFPADTNPYSILNVVRSMASFTRSIVSFDSPYDQYLRGHYAAFGESEERGLALFFSERLECFHCHGGINFTDSSTHANALVESVGFHNNGLYNIGNTGAYPSDNTGLFDLTGVRRDMGRFKAPTLRNIGLTAPYMHDGSLRTLDDVIDHYQRGGREISAGPHAGDGRRSPHKSVFIKQFALDDTERDDLKNFLRSLTDVSVTVNPAFSDPFDSGPVE